MDGGELAGVSGAGVLACLRRAQASALYRTGGARLLSLAARRLALGLGGRRVRPGPTFPSARRIHRVNDAGDPFFPAVPTEVFERQMSRTVARAYASAHGGGAGRAAGPRRAVPRNALAITFDDGYRDNADACRADPGAASGVPATVFLVTGAVASGEPLWFDRLAAAFKQAATPAWRAPWGESLPLETQGQRLAALGQTLGRFKRLVNEERRRSVEQVLLTLGTGDERPLKSLMLSWDDVRALMGLGITIGAHTVSHPILSQLTPAEAHTEIFESYRMIEAACRRAPRAFAYPNGRPDDYGPAVLALVREAGFTCAVTTTFGVNTTSTPAYELRRGGPWEPHLPTFALGMHLIGNISQTVATFIVGRLLGGTALELYGMAQSLAEGPHRISTGMINQVSFPVFAKLQDDREELARYFLKISKYLALVSLPAQVGLILVAPEVIPLVLSSKWEPAVVPFQIICIESAVVMMTLTASPLLTAIGRASFMLRRSLFSLGAMSIATLVGVPFGLVGVALARLMSMVPLRLSLLLPCLWALEIPFRVYVEDAGVPAASHCSDGGGRRRGPTRDGGSGAARTCGDRGGGGRRELPGRPDGPRPGLDRRGAHAGT